MMKNTKRVFAWLGIIVIAALFLTLAFLTFTGGPANAILAVLFCLLVIPVLLYAYVLIIKMRRRGETEHEDTGDGTSAPQKK